jgi:hypothetical protein
MHRVISSTNTTKSTDLIDIVNSEFDRTASEAIGGNGFLRGKNPLERQKTYRKLKTAER